MPGHLQYAVHVKVLQNAVGLRDYLAGQPGVFGGGHQPQVARAEPALAPGDGAQHPHPQRPQCLSARRRVPLAAHAVEYHAAHHAVSAEPQKPQYSGGHRPPSAAGVHDQYCRGAGHLRYVVRAGPVASPLEPVVVSHHPFYDGGRPAGVAGEALDYSAPAHQPRVQVRHLPARGHRQVPRVYVVGAGLERLNYMSGPPEPPDQGARHGGLADAAARSGYYDPGLSRAGSSS